MVDIQLDELERASEQLERKALQSLHQHCSPDLRADLGLDLIEVEDGLVACSSTDYSILLNRVAGLGVHKSVTVDALRQVQEIYASRGIANYFLHIYPDSLEADAQQMLDGEDFDKRRGWMKFCAKDPQPRTAETELRVEQVGVDKSEDFGRIVCNAFGMSDLSIPLLASLANDDRWKLFVSYDGDQAAGAGAIFIEGNMGWIEWGATDPDFRRRGSQAAIMAARLNLASEMGVDYVFTETGEEVEGDPQHSYKNILKAGFEESILRANYAPSQP